jgi:hypothetical protein
MGSIATELSLMRHLSVVVELPIAHSGREGLPLDGIESKYWSPPVLRVSYRDLPINDCNLKATVGCTICALLPLWARTAHCPY